MKKNNYPEHLSLNDTIGVFSPSAPLAGLVPHRTENGINNLQKLGFKTIISNHALDVTSYTAGTAKQRAEDLMNLFLDDKVKAIISCIGGYNSNQILKYLDFDLIKKHPKIIIGYSDMTVILLAIYKKCGFSTFYGPSVLNQFADSYLPNYTLDYFKKAVMHIEPIGKIAPSENWTDEFLDWFEKKDLIRNRKYNVNHGFEWLKLGKATGKILGGCLETLLHLRGTEYWPDFKNNILFFETCEGNVSQEKGQTIQMIDSYITDLELSNIFNEISGLVIGIPYGYDDKERESFKKLIKERLSEYNFPILFNVNIGHCDPIITVPIGINVNLDSETNTFEIIESAVV